MSGATTPTERVDAILSAINVSGGEGAYLSDRLDRQPHEFGFGYQGNDYNLQAHVWTVTEADREDDEEYRIQRTADPPLERNPNGLSLLLGYFAERGMLAGFDYEQEREYGGNSPSSYIRLWNFDNAEQDGLSFYQGNSGKISVAIRPDHFLYYALNAADIHRQGAHIAEELGEVASGGSAEDLNVSSEDRTIGQTQIQERSRILRELEQYTRDAHFRERVCQAYGYRCAITGKQLSLIDAAHILPVSAGGPDEVRNGICLSPTMHRAFDNALIFLDTDCILRLNEKKFEALEAQNRGRGMDQITPYLGEKILLPDREQNQPHPDYIREANERRLI